MDTDPPISKYLQTFTWDGEGFQPGIECRGWLAALMNWELRFDPAGIGPFERHNQTDEVFVLLLGQGALLVGTPAGIQVVEMQPGVIYNVTAGTWHSAVGTRDVRWLVLESSDTSRENSEYRTLNPEDVASVRAQLPDWGRNMNR